ncbi:hypothetical protein BD311DRAFT_108626 [Dichomitus squalens]|uniref:Uncharacterized protein n=1 Tax=Dichomitus squalens TaxID=114155 RepID=A0A4Q9M7J1_9APHY|nr:hypothetical protein BD311DRAFT_108626 [Dichomitus squalens]
MREDEGRKSRSLWGRTRQEMLPARQPTSIYVLQWAHIRNTGVTHHPVKTRSDNPIHSGRSCCTHYKASTAHATTRDYRRIRSGVRRRPLLASTVQNAQEWSLLSMDSFTCCAAQRTPNDGWCVDRAPHSRTIMFDCRPASSPRCDAARSGG